MKLRNLSLLFSLTLLLSACGLNMYDQPKTKVNRGSPFFADGAANRPLIEGTVSRERGNIDPSFYSGQDANGMATDLPFPVTLEVLERGQERFNIYCSPCHNYSGNGLGVIVQKGMPQPRSFHDPNVRTLPVGYFYNAMTNGFGRMFAYGSRIPPEDRWAIAAYIKTLQLSQNASLDDVPEEMRSELKAGGESQ